MPYVFLKYVETSPWGDYELSFGKLWILLSRFFHCGFKMMVAYAGYQQEARQNVASLSIFGRRTSRELRAVVNFHD